MAGTGGFFLKGLGSGLQSGFQMGQQMQEMKWQKEQRKKLEDKQKKIEESISGIRNLFKQYGADNAYSDDEIMQLNTALLASIPEVQEIYKGAINNIQTMNKAKFEEDLQWLDLFIDWTGGLDPSNVQGVFDTVKGRVQTDKGKQLFTAYDTISKKRYEAQPTTEVFATAEAVQKAYPDQGFKYDSTAKGYVPTFQKPEAPKTELDIMGETGKKLDYAYATGNASHFNQMAKSLGVDTTFETYKQKHVEGEAKRTDIAYWTKRFDDVTNEDEWNTTMRDLEMTDTTWKPKGTYKDKLISEVKEMADTIKRELLTPDNKFINDKAKEQYLGWQRLYEQKIREIMQKYPDIDINRFAKYLSIEEIKPVGFWKGLITGGGIAKGDYSVIDIKGW